MVVEIDDKGERVKDSPLRGAVVRSHYLPQRGSYIILSLTRGESHTMTAEAEFKIPRDPKEKFEDRVYRVEEISHSIAATILIDLTDIAKGLETMASDPDGAKALSELAGIEVPQGKSMQHLRDQTK